MSIQYADLVDDHDAIVRAADDLLAAADAAVADPADLVTRLHDLRAMVRDHISAETPLIATLDDSTLSGPWLSLWHKARPAYLTLRADWQEFLMEWSEDAVANDLAAFRQAAREMFGRLAERVSFESETFYAVALQTGALRFSPT